MSARNPENVTIYEVWKAWGKPSYSFLAKHFNTTRNRVAGAIWRGRQREAS